MLTRTIRVLLPLLVAFTLLVSVAAKSSTYAKRFPANRAEYLKTCTSLLNHAYPYDAGYPAEEQALRAEMEADLVASGTLADVNVSFVGHCPDNDPNDCIGVRRFVWAPAGGRDVTVGFPGSFSFDDWTWDFAAYGETLTFDTAEYTVSEALKFGVPAAYIQPRNRTVQLLTSAGLLELWPSRLFWFQSRLSEYTGMSREDVIDKGYFKLALDIVAEVRAQYPHRKLHLTGHSLGAALAELVALDEESKGRNVDTPIFAAPGAKCLVTKKKWNYHVERNHAQIVNYRNIYDPVTYTDIHVGRECLLNTVHDDGLERCIPLFGLGAEVAAIPEVYAAYLACLGKQHDIFRYYQDFKTGILRNDGTVKGLGCRKAPKQQCPFNDRFLEDPFFTTAI